MEFPSHKALFNFLGAILFTHKVARSIAMSHTKLCKPLNVQKARYLSSLYIRALKGVNGFELFPFRLWVFCGCNGASPQNMFYMATLPDAKIGSVRNCDCDVWRAYDGERKPAKFTKPLSINIVVQGNINKSLLRPVVMHYTKYLEQAM